MASRSRAKSRTKRPRGRPAGGSEAIVQSIFDATLEQLGARGYAQMRVEEVAARAGVNKTSIYRRWPAKSDLVLAALHSFRQEVESPPDTGSLHGDLVALLRGVLEKVTSPRGAAIIRALMVAGDPELADVARSLWDRYYATPSPIFDRAIERGELPRGADTALLRELLTAPLFHRTFIVHERVDDAFIARAIDAVLGGMRADAARPPRTSSARRRRNA